MNKYLEEIKKLIDDEVEAIDGYDHAILLFNGSDVIETLQHIKEQELEHIELLKKLREEINKKDFDPDENGDIE